MNKRLLALAALGEAQAHPPGGIAPKFEVASVSVTPLVDPGRLSFSGCPLKTLVAWAYDLKDDPIEGGLGWIDSLDNRYDVMRMMLRALLADRFQLKVHRENRERAAFALLVDKGGSKLREAGPGKALHPGSPCHVGQDDDLDR